MAEMAWEELKSGGNGEGTPYVKLQPGVNTMRLLGLPFETEVHWEETNDGSKKRIVCSGMGCPICKAGHVPQKKFQVLVIDRSDAKIKILEGGSSIFRQIKDYAMDPDYGDPTKYDVKIKKEGSGRETKYSIMASPNKGSITQEEAALLEGAKSLSELNKPKSIEDLMQMDLAVLGSATSANFDGGWSDGENAATVKTDANSFDDWDSL